MVILAASDQHLGYENADRDAFNSFLDQLRTAPDPTITHLVLLGDVVDMWRRDASGVFLENMETFNKIAALPKNIQVHYVYGNHDFHVRKLKSHSYPFKFTNEFVIGEEGRNYRFVHGYQFDIEQQEPFMEALCRAMSDDVGEFESGVWAMLTRDWTYLKFLFGVIKKRGIRKTLARLQMKPEDRLVATIHEVEARANAKVNSDEILVFGHTHAPFINEAGTLVNTGSWVKDSCVHNTYARLEPAGPRLFVFGQNEITERKQCPSVPEKKNHRHGILARLFPSTYN